MFKPVKMQNSDTVLGGDMKLLLPPLEDIPSDFMDLGFKSKWTKAFSDMFYSKVKNIQVIEKEGIDIDMAMEHIFAIMASFEPKHQVKQGAVAYLLSIWFEDFKYEVVKADEKEERYE